MGKEYVEVVFRNMPSRKFAQYQVRTESSFIIVYDDYDENWFPVELIEEVKLSTSKWWTY